MSLVIVIKGASHELRPETARLLLYSGLLLLVVVPAHHRLYTVHCALKPVQ